MDRKQSALANKLRDRGVPAEWAILISKRSWIRGLANEDAVSNYLAGGFVWSETQEGHLFWNGVCHAIAEELEEPAPMYIDYVEEEVY